MSEMTETPVGDRAGKADLQQLLARAEQGATGVLDQLRAFLDENREVWQQAGDLARHAEMSLIDLAAGNNLLLKESISRKLAELKQELEPASPLERLVVERIAISWVQVHHADLDAIAAQAGNHGTSPRAVHAQRRLGLYLPIKKCSVVPTKKCSAPNRHPGMLRAAFGSDNGRQECSPTCYCGRKSVAASLPAS